MMKQSTVPTAFLLGLLIITITYNNHVSCLVDVEMQNVVYSLFRHKPVYKKILSCHHRKSAVGRKEKDKVDNMRTPTGDQLHRSRVRRQAYWPLGAYSFGQPPLNPTGPPPGAFSPGTPFAYLRSPKIRRQTRTGINYVNTRTIKLETNHVPSTHVQNRSPCPYKLLAEKLIAVKQPRQSNNYTRRAHSLPEMTEMETTEKAVPTLTTPTIVNPVEVALNARVAEVLSVLLKNYVSKSQ